MYLVCFGKSWSDSGQPAVFRLPFSLLTLLLRELFVRTSQDTDEKKITWPAGFTAHHQTLVHGTFGFKFGCHSWIWL